MKEININNQITHILSFFFNNIFALLSRLYPLRPYHLVFCMFNVH